MWISGRYENVKTYLYCIYCKVKTRIQGEKCHTIRSRCACVEYIVPNPNSMMLLEIRLLFNT
jgi:hypothetical protein